MRCEIIRSTAPFHSEFTCPACDSLVSLKVSVNDMHRDGTACTSCNAELVVTQVDGVKLVLVKPVTFTSTTVANVWDGRVDYDDRSF